MLKINKNLIMETGTFVPTLAGTITSGTGTYILQSGRYTKIGNVLFYDFKMGLSAFSGGSGNFMISGLPYTNTLTSTTNLATLMCEGAIFAGNHIRTLWWTVGLIISAANNTIGALPVANISSNTYLYASGVLFLNE